jgi:WD40 repeat protein
MSCVEILQDAIRFVGRFGSILNKSAIHIYFSALPFTPQGTTLYRVYSARYRDIPRVTLGFLEAWPEELCTIRNLGGSHSTPRHLAFSADSSESRLALSTATHLVTTSPLTGVQLGKYRFASGGPGTEGNAEMPIALACRTGYLASITSSLLLRIVESRSLEETQLSFPYGSADSPRLPSSPHPLPVTCATFNQDVNVLFVGCRDGRIQLWRLRSSSWEPENDIHPHSHSSAVHCMAAASELLASVSQRELKIGLYDDANPAYGGRETLRLSTRWLAEAHDVANGNWNVRLSFAATSAVAWACAVSSHSSASDNHNIYLFTADNQRDKKIFTSNSLSYPIYALSLDASVLTVVCDDVLRRWSTVSYGLLEKRNLQTIDSTRLDRFPVISPDGRLLAFCDGEVVHVWDLLHPPLRRPDHAPNIKAAGVILTDNCYIVKPGKQQWLARVRDEGIPEDIVQLGEHNIEHLAVSTDGSKLAALSFYKGKTRHGLLEVADLNSRRRSTTTWPVALHESFTDWEICNMEFSATRKHIAIVFFLSEASYICSCDLESGTLRWKQLPGKMRPLAARSWEDEELIVVRTKDLWKVNLETVEGSRHELYSRDPYKMGTSYARFAETGSSGLLEMTSRLWNKPPWYTVWNTDTVTRVETKIKCTVAHLEVYQKNSFGHWVLDSMGQRVCCIPEEYCSNWGVKTHCSIGHDRLAILNEDGAVLVVDFHPMMEYLGMST